MKIYSMKPGHDGAVALIDTEQQRLLWSFEAEKDSFPRYEAFNPHQFVETAGLMDQVPDVIAISGWGKNSLDEGAAVGAGYYGITDDQAISETRNLFGKEVQYFSSSHESSHLWCAYGLSPYDQGQPVYALVWEGALGDFYFIDEQLQVHHLGSVMKTPGNKYGFLYALADPTFTLPKGKLRFEDPGKLMALCSYGESGEMTPQEQELTDFLLDRDSILLSLAKDDLKNSPYYNIGLEHPDFTRMAKRFSDALFERFHQYARKHLTQGKHPLLVVGGCGLNCDWNTMWKDCGLFDDVFVPPCTNDTGSAIGTAVDAMRRLTGKAKVSWDVYCGPAFVDDKPDMHDVHSEPLDVDKLAEFLGNGGIVGWAQGRCEIGPRALGNRSILAEPFSTETRDRLNAIKKREGFRPVAPICLEEEVHRHFDWQGPSPHMLYFQNVINRDLRAITHVDGTARAQTVNREQNPGIHALLSAFRDRYGAGVLCNTSLNFNGTGFINRTSDLYHYSRSNGLDGFVYNDTFCTFKSKV